MLLLFTLVTVSGFEAGASVLEIPEDCSQINISPFLDILEDRQGALNLLEIIQPDVQERFSPSNTPTLDLGITWSTYWCRFYLKPPPSTERSGTSQINQKKTWLLDIDRAWIPVLELWIPVNGEHHTKDHWQKLSPIFAHNSNENGFISRSTIFPIPENYDGSRAFFLKIASWGPPLNLSVRITETDVFRNQMTVDFGLFGIIYGIMLAMILYNCFIYLSLHDRTYLLYVLYILSTFTYMSVSIGHMLALINISPGNFFFLIYVMCGLSFFFAAYFCRSFLGTRRNTPFLDKILAGQMWLALSLSILAVFQFHHFNQLLCSIIGVIFPFTAIAAGLTCTVKGFRPAGYFLAAWSVLCTGILLWALRGLGAVPHSQIITYAFPAAVAAETILLSLALADRIRLLRKENRQLEINERRLLMLSNTDGLTKLFNKRYCDERIRNESIIAEELNLPLSLLILDLDDFKSINDKYGHPVGDRVLQHLGKVIRRSIRDTDYGCRYGGEEFAIILTGMNAKGGWKVAERIRWSMEESQFKDELGETFTVTISIGLAEYQYGEDVSELIKRADQALYRAKKQGKNQTRKWESDEWRAASIN